MIFKVVDLSKEVFSMFHKNNGLLKKVKDSIKDASLDVINFLPTKLFNITAFDGVPLKILIIKTYMAYILIFILFFVTLIIEFVINPGKSDSIRISFIINIGNNDGKTLVTHKFIAKIIF